MPHKLFVPFLDRPLVTKVTTVLNKGERNVELLAEALQILVEDLDQFCLWLKDLREDKTLMTEITQRSYWHPNGFAKLVLHESDEKEQDQFLIRLHVWPATQGDHLGESNPHSHRWDFASTILLGEGMSTTEFTECDNCGSPYNRYRYGTVSTDKAALKNDGQPVMLTGIPSLVIKRGQIYQCDTSVAHTVQPLGSDLTATIILRGPHRSSSTTVYRKPELSTDQPNRPISEDEVREILDEVITGIGPLRKSTP